MEVLELRRARAERAAEDAAVAYGLSKKQVLGRPRTHRQPLPLLQQRACAARASDAPFLWAQVGVKTWVIKEVEQRRDATAAALRQAQAEAEDWAKVLPPGAAPLERFKANGSKG